MNHWWCATSVMGPFLPRMHRRTASIGDRGADGLRQAKDGYDAKEPLFRNGKGAPDLRWSQGDSNP